MNERTIDALRTPGNLTRQQHTASRDRSCDRDCAGVTPYATIRLSKQLFDYQPGAQDDRTKPSQGLPRPYLLRCRHAPGRRAAAQAIGSKFSVEFGPLSDEPRGPHPISQFNVIFKIAEFQNLVPWLMLNRGGLDVLVHPLTESSYDDHSKNALWLGAPVPLKLDILRPTYRPEQYPTA
jgi:aromatic ring-cleaving dioxygenase